MTLNTQLDNKHDFIAIFMKISDEEFIKAVLWIEYKQSKPEVRKPVLEVSNLCM